MGEAKYSRIHKSLLNLANPPLNLANPPLNLTYIHYKSLLFIINHSIFHEKHRVSSLTLLDLNQSQNGLTKLSTSLYLFICISLSVSLYPYLFIRISTSLHSSFSIIFINIVLLYYFLCRGYYHCFIRLIFLSSHLLFVFDENEELNPNNSLISLVQSFSFLATHHIPSTTVASSCARSLTTCISSPGRKSI